MYKTKNGSETEVTCDFVFEPPQATIGLQCSAFAGRWRPLLYCVFAFYESNLTYVTVPLY